MVSMTYRWIVRICRIGAPFIFLVGIGVHPAAGESDLVVVTYGDASSGPFYTDKFACARWVEKKAPDKKCLECHATIIREDDLAADKEISSSSGVMNIHAQHMGTNKVNFTCLTCHEKVDPYQGSSSGVRNQVPANMCFKCHFPHGKE